MARYDHQFKLLIIGDSGKLMPLAGAHEAWQMRDSPKRVNISLNFLPTQLVGGSLSSIIYCGDIEKSTFCCL